MHQFELDELAKERDRTEVKPVLPSFTLFNRWKIYVNIIKVEQKHIFKFFLYVLDWKVIFDFNCKLYLLGFRVQFLLDDLFLFISLKHNHP